MPGQLVLVGGGDATLTAQPAGVPGYYRDVASFAALTFLLILRPGGLLAPAAEAYERV